MLSLYRLIEYITMFRFTNNVKIMIYISMHISVTFRLVTFIKLTRTIFSARLYFIFQDFSTHQ